MRQPSKATLGLVVFLGSFALMGAGSDRAWNRASEPTERDAYAVTVSIEPEGPASFLLRARVEDAVTGQMLFAPMMRFAPGESATMHSPLRDFQLKVTVTADTVNRRAEYTATLLSGFRVLSAHTARVTL